MPVWANFASLPKARFGLVATNIVFEGAGVERGDFAPMNCI